MKKIIYSDPFQKNLIPNNDFYIILIGNIRLYSFLFIYFVVSLR